MKIEDALSYDPVTGIIVWKVFRGSRAQAGDTAGSIWKNKYRTIEFQGKSYRAHRVAWRLMTGVWPEQEVDHRDLDGLNNRWNNLRLATRGQNQQNSKRQRNNTTGFKGVSRHLNRFQAEIVCDKKRFYLGHFQTPEEAHAAYCKAAVKHFGTFARFS